jgi:GTP-binding protein YchF
MFVGICGYPGSGKTTVFSALAPGSATGKGITYGNIKVPDARVDALAAIFSPKKRVYAEITFLDVGGTGGMRPGSGAFPPDTIQHMRNADVLVHVVRGFENPMLMEDADLARDISRFDDELLLLDLGLMEKRHDRFRRANEKGLDAQVAARAVEHLEEGEPLRTMALTEDELDTLTGIQLLSGKPLIVLANLDEEGWEDDENVAWRSHRDEGINRLSMGICGEMEAEIATMDPEDQGEFLESLGITEPARNAFIQAAYRLMDLISFLTAGPDECRAWPIRRGSVARKAAGKVHSDIERGFIRAEVYRLEELQEYGSEAELKKQGKMRVEGKGYLMVDGDVVNYRFNV